MWLGQSDKDKRKVWRPTRSVADDKDRYNQPEVWLGKARDKGVWLIDKKIKAGHMTSHQGW